MGITRYSYILIATSAPSGPILRQLAEIPETCFVSAIAGSYDVDTEVRVGSDAQHQEVLNRIRSIPGVNELNCNSYERIVVNIDSPLPEVGGAPLRIDDADRRMLLALERDGRATFRELGVAAGVSAASARNRLQRLRHMRAVKIVGLPVRDQQEGPPPLGLGIRVRGDLEAALAPIRAIEPEFLAVSTGNYDLIGTVSADTHAALLAKLDALHGIEQVSSVDSWSHLRISKELYGFSESAGGVDAAPGPRVAAPRPH
nr:AsnC family transcriptional regulator [Leucobacter luti]